MKKKPDRNWRSGWEAFIQRYKVQSLPIVATGSSDLRLKFQAEADLSLSVTVLLTLGCGLPERSIVDRCVRTVESCAVKQVEVIDLQNTLEAFTQIEVLSDVRAFVVVSRLLQISE